MKAVIYHRVSTVEQDPTTARETLRQAAQSRGYEIVEEIEEVGSGAINNRPGLQKLMDLVQTGKVKAVLVWALDRFGRSPQDLLNNIDILQTHRCVFVAVHQHFEVRPDADPASMLLLQVLAAVSQFERRMIIDRTKQGLKRVRLHGSKSGKTIGNNYKFAKLTSRDYEKVRVLKSQGLSLKTISTEFGCSIKEVRRALGTV